MAFLRSSYWSAVGPIHAGQQFTFTVMPGEYFPFLRRCRLQTAEAVVGQSRVLDVYSIDAQCIAGIPAAGIELVFQNGADASLELFTHEIPHMIVGISTGARTIRDACETPQGIVAMAYRGRLVAEGCFRQFPRFRLIDVADR